ncbi:hypothetical protein BHE74_00028399 [Ensete ventricosum]|nr:hypothetical protein BHE74_00028399 [Ensete ventricosum]
MLDAHSAMLDGFMSAVLRVLRRRRSRRGVEAGRRGAHRSYVRACRMLSMAWRGRTRRMRCSLLPVAAMHGINDT